MMQEKNSKHLFDRLTKLDPKRGVSKSGSWASGYGINNGLREALGTAVHIIDPATSSVASLASDNHYEAIEGTVNYIKMISGYSTNGQAIKNGFIHADGGVLKKPVVMVWNNASVKVKSEDDAEAVGGSHWQTCIMLPKNYITPFGYPIKNNTELVFFVDSLYEGQVIPTPFREMLVQERSFVFKSEGRTFYHTIGGAFPQAQFFNFTPKQQLGGSDCGWWAVYNAIMIVFTGNADFLGRFNKRSRDYAYALREVFSNLDEQQPGIKKELVAKVEEKDNKDQRVIKAAKESLKAPSGQQKVKSKERNHALIPNKSKYEVRYDDSSSDEEGEELDNTGMRFFQDSIEEATTHEDNGHNAEDLELSFLVHEFGLRVLKAPEVNSQYYGLMLKHLRQNKVLTDETIRACVESAIKVAFPKTYPKGKLKDFLSDNEAAIEELIAIALTDKRAFIRAVQERHIRKVLPDAAKLFKLPRIKKELDKDTVLGLVQEIHIEIELPINSNPGELGKAKLKYAQLKKKLVNYKSDNPVKQVLANRLKGVGSSISLDAFYKGCQHIALPERNEADTFIDNLNQALSNAVKKASRNKVYRQTLPDSYTFSYDGEYTVAKFLAFTRILHRSNVRLMRNLEDNESMLEDDKEVVGRAFSFPGTGSSAVDIHKIFKNTLTRSDLVETSSSYANIADVLAKIRTKAKLEDVDLVGLVKAILQGKGETALKKLKINDVQRKDIAKFLNSLTYLLFSTEVARNPASLIIHFMILDLIEAGELSWDKALRGAMPMALEDAVSAARWTHQNFKTKVRYSYDKTKEGNNISAATSETLRNFIALEASVFRDWLKLKGIKGTVADNLDGIMDELAASCSTWYEIDIEPKQALIERLADKLGIKEGDLNELSEKDLKACKEVALDYLEECQRLLGADVSISAIVDVYRESQAKFTAVSTKAVCALLQSSELDESFEDVCEFYDNCEDMDKFNTIINDEHDLLPEYGLKELSDKYDEMQSQEDPESPYDIDPYEAVYAQHCKDNSYDYSSHSDTEESSSENEHGYYSAGYNSEDAEEEPDQELNCYASTDSEDESQNSEQEDYVREEEQAQKTAQEDGLNMVSDNDLMREILSRIQQGKIDPKLLLQSHSSDVGTTTSSKLRVGIPHHVTDTFPRAQASYIGKHKDRSFVR